MKVKFLKDYATKEAKPQTFKKDQVVEYEDDETGRASAMHYINRGIAEEVVEPEPRGKKAAADKPPDKLVPDAPEPFGSSPPKKA